MLQPQIDTDGSVRELDPLLRSTLAPPARTLVDILAETARAHPDAPAIDDGDTALTYTELLAEIAATVERLGAAGVRRGDRVGVRMPSGTRELYVTILAVLHAGAAYVPVDADDPDEGARHGLGGGRRTPLVTPPRHR